MLLEASHGHYRRSCCQPVATPRLQQMPMDWPGRYRARGSMVQISSAAQCYAEWHELRTWGVRCFGGECAHSVPGT